MTKPQLFLMLSSIIIFFISISPLDSRKPIFDLDKKWNLTQGLQPKHLSNFKRNPQVDTNLFPNLITTNCTNITTINNNPQVSQSRLQASGYLNVGSAYGDSALYFMYYTYNGSQRASHNDIVNKPLIIWLNGGPGSTSQYGNFYEMGPFWLNETSPNSGIYQENPRQFSWNTNYNMLFIDQPIGTGLSYANDTSYMPQSQAQVAQQFYNALQEIWSLSANFNLNPCSLLQFIENTTEVYLMGESYAGKYVPAIANRILQGNRMHSLNPSSNHFINLKGISIGDGFTDPLTITYELSAFAYNLGLIDFQERQIVEKWNLQLYYAAQNQDWNTATNLFNNYIFPFIQNAGGNVFAYNIFQFGNNAVDMSGLDVFFSNLTVLKQYNVNPKVTFNSESADVYNALWIDFMQPYVNLYESLLLNNSYSLKFLIYQGQNDLIVNNMGTAQWVDNMLGGTLFAGMDYDVWYDNNKNVVGYKKSMSNQDIKHFEFRIVNNAGHFVPYYQGQNSLSMLDDFINQT